MQTRAGFVGFANAVGSGHTESIVFALASIRIPATVATVSSCAVTDRPHAVECCLEPLSVGCGTMRVGAAARASVEQSSPVRFTQSQVAVVPIHSTVVYTRTT